MQDPPNGPGNDGRMSARRVLAVGLFLALFAQSAIAANLGELNAIAARDRQLDHAINALEAGRANPSPSAPQVLTSWQRLRRTAAALLTDARALSGPPEAARLQAVDLLSRETRRIDLLIRMAHEESERNTTALSRDRNELARLVRGRNQSEATLRKMLDTLNSAPR